MLTPANFKNALEAMGFHASDNIYEKEYPALDVSLKADLAKRKLFYPEEIKGRERNDFYDESHKENLVVFECVNRLLVKGYRPEHIELEKEWHLGHDAKGGRADICVTAPDGKMLFIIECKTIDKEYQSEYRKIKADGGQLFSYWQQERSTQWLVLYASDYEEGKVIYQTDSIDCHDDQNILLTAQKDSSIKLYQNAHTTEELFDVWDETYEKRFCGDVLFRDDTIAYQIGVKPLRKGDLKDFAEKDGVVNQFEEILRHNNVSDKENAFNRLVALFICKLVDEMQKSDKDEVDFQYKVGTDTYETLQDRLQRLHKEGMKEFMREDIFYVPDSYAEDLLQQYTGQKRAKMIDELKKTLRYLKFYTNNDFTFKDVHNEELFYQNGKILVEVVQLFEKYRIIDSNDLQVLGDLFEQLLNKGFKQNEGQFFTPIPITRFIWDSLPLDNVISEDNEITYPKIIDYACGAGHFLTQGYEAVEDCRQRHDLPADEYWTEKKLYGVEKDYRLARVSKISLFMHGAGKGNIIFGDGLDNYQDKDITPGTFDILVANPPYSVSAFKPHLKLKDNNFDILPKISNNGSEIETLFVERIAQLLKPKGIAAVILPSSILKTENKSFIAARESLLTNFQIKAIAQFGGKTFGATDTETVILFLEKYNEPPKRIDLVSDSVSAILSSKKLTDWEDNDILSNYLRKIGVDKNSYLLFVSRGQDYSVWESSPYFSMYVSAFLSSAEYLTKAKQKSFLNLSEAEQTCWCNDHFYDFALKIESEKLTYFALCYRQTTLVITAPTDDKAQKAFLGYTWSTRKGQEGIQIKSEGGLLYSPKNRKADNTMAALVKSSLAGDTTESAELTSYYDWLPLKDMLNFSTVDFNKAIKTTRIRNTIIKEGMTLYKLNSNDFDVSIGNRVVASEIEADGLYPVYSANVFEEFGRISKQNIKDFSKPSIIWGIDGDWMVNYIPENHPFYPTDHCGVLRVNTKDIIPKYMALALRVEGNYERFSRSNRASTARVKNLTVQIPSKKTQQDIVKEIEHIDIEIDVQDKIIEKCNRDVKSRFVEMFGNSGYPTIMLKDICSKITDGTHKTPLYQREGIPFVSAKNIKEGKLVFDDIKYISDTEYDEIQKRCQISNGDLLLTKSGSLGMPALVEVDFPFGVFESLAVLKYDRSRLNGKFLHAQVSSDDFQYRLLKGVKGIAIKHLHLNVIGATKIIVPPLEMQNQFSDFVVQADKSKFDAQKTKDSLISRREEIIAKHFK